MVSPIPQGFHSITPSLTVKGAAEALDFYQKAFNAVVNNRYEGPDGLIVHCQFTVGNSPVFMSEEAPEWGALSPKTIGGCPSLLMIYTENCDALFQQAIEAGAEELQPVMDQFWGDRSGLLIDPFGYRWTIATHKEELSEAEMNERLKIVFAKGND